MTPTVKLVEELNQLRADLHFFATTVNVELERSRETALSRTAIEEAMMFVGGTLKELNDGQTPYINSENPLNTKIDPFYVHEKSKPLALPEEWSHWEYVQKVKWVRMMLELTLTKFKIVRQDSLVGFSFAMFMNAIMHCVRSKNWLGMELARLRDSKS